MPKKKMLVLELLDGSIMRHLGGLTWKFMLREEPYALTSARTDLFGGYPTTAIHAATSSIERHSQFSNHDSG